MTRSAAILLLLLTAWTQAAFAQQADDTLNDTQKLGRQVFAQSCGVCHLPPAINARTYGPGLSKDTAGGSDEVIRGVISEGTPRMPALQALPAARRDRRDHRLPQDGPRHRHPVNGRAQGETP